MAEVQGWLTPCSASIIAHLSAHQLRLGLSGNVAEIGVHHGKLFILLANLIAPDEVAYAVDIFDDQHKNIDRSGKGDRVIFEDNVRKYAPHANVVVIQESSLELDGTDFMSTSFRMISVDGGHTGPITCSDLHLSEKRIVDGGIVVLDDILNPDWTGVITGLVKYFSEGGKLVPFALSANKLYLAAGRKEATAYASNLRASFPMALSKRSVEFFGFTVDVFTEHPYYDRSGQAGLRKRVDDMHREVVAIQRMNLQAANQVSEAHALVGAAGRELEAARSENQRLKEEISRLQRQHATVALNGATGIPLAYNDGATVPQ
ncbi:class I SAM-dependent methyltransferase [Burkholderia vietnamiensis]|nr:class I SAM-dependent methyltransferase [Burkholderia vietnamiensis]MCA8013620.1 class I SAM-dependent methyltransferase [Burkholderia vietnamiensis]